MHDEHSEIRELIPAYVWGTTDSDDTARVESHLRGCPDCLAIRADYLALRDRMLWAVPWRRAPASAGGSIMRRVHGSSLRRQPWLIPTIAAFIAGLAVTTLVLYWLGGQECSDRW